jgi:hypothetical protein
MTHRSTETFTCRNSKIRTVVLLPVLFESRNDQIAARSESGMPCTLQRDDYKLVNLDWSWCPALAINATVQPVNIAIGSTLRCDLRCIQTTIVSMSQ